LGGGGVYSEKKHVGVRGLNNCPVLIGTLLQKKIRNPGLSKATELITNLNISSSIFVSANAFREPCFQALFTPD
jgi:hypothetical protein